MNWYLTKLVFRIICGEGRHTPQFDEQLRLIWAEDELAAYEKALAIGHQEQEEFYSADQKLVRWKFINLSELYKLSGLLDGAEIYSKIQEVENPDLFVELTHKKAAHIRQSTTHKILEIL